MTASSEVARAKEELEVVRKEMGCTWRGYLSLSRCWKERAVWAGFNSGECGGRKAFALSQEALWTGLAEKSLEAFRPLLPQIPTPLPDGMSGDVLYSQIPISE